MIASVPLQHNHSFVLVCHNDVYLLSKPIGPDHALFKHVFVIDNDLRKLISYHWSSERVSTGIWLTSSMIAVSSCSQQIN